MSPKNTEVTLLTMIASAVLRHGGLIQAKLKDKPVQIIQATTSNGTKYEYKDQASEDSLSWVNPEDAINYLIMNLDIHKKPVDSVIFYPTPDDNTGVTWRGLKVDMSFLRIVLIDDKIMLRTIVDRIASIIFASKDDGRIDPTLN